MLCCSILSFVSSLEVVCMRCHEHIPDSHVWPYEYFCALSSWKTRIKMGMWIQELLLYIYGPNEAIHQALGRPAVANIVIPPGIIPPRAPLQQGKKVTIYEWCSVMLRAVNRFGEIYSHPWVWLVLCGNIAVHHNMSGSTSAWKAAWLTLASFPLSWYTQAATFEGTLHRPPTTLTHVCTRACCVHPFLYTFRCQCRSKFGQSP